MAEENVTIRLLVSCFDVPSCMVFFEPEGADIRLNAGDVFTVELSGSSPALPEVTFVPDGIVINAWAGAETRAWNRAGVELRL